MLLKILCDKDTYMLSEHVGVAEQTLKSNGQCSMYWRYGGTFKM